MAEIEQVKCPVCGWHRPIEQKGTMRLQRGDPANQPKGKFAFGNFDLDQVAFISIRESRGRGGGLPEIGRITLKEVMERDTYKELRQSLVTACYNVLKILMGDEK